MLHFAHALRGSRRSLQTSLRQSSLRGSLRGSLPGLQTAPRLCLGSRTYAKHTFEDLVNEIPDTPQSHLDVDELDWSDLQQAKAIDESPTEWQPPEQKEDMIFKEVLNQVLANPQPAPAKPLTESILALFDRSEHRQPSSQLNQPRKAAGPTSSELRAKKRIDDQLADVYAHISSLPTNRDVMGYFVSVVVPRFSLSSTLAASAQKDAVTPCSAEDPLVGPETVSWILEKCISVLATEFRDPLGAIHLFEQSKRRSIEFFSVACSAEVYNQIIRIRWHDYRDLYAVVNLAAELAINAIPPSLETTELLASIYRDAIDSSKGMGTSPYGMPLWTGQDVKRLDELNRYRTRFQSSWAARPARF